jgi:hypothetical protein
MSLKVIPVKAHVAARERGTKPTVTKDGLAKLIFQIGQDADPEPPVYRFPLPSPVSPSIALGVVMSVVKVAFCGNCAGSAQARTQLKKRTKADKVETKHLLLIVVTSYILAYDPRDAALVYLSYFWQSTAGRRQEGTA